MDAVILAAGQGTRLKPLTSTKPKPMLPVAGRPILEWDLEALSENNFKKAYIIVGYKKERIIDYFGDEYNGLKIEYIHQKEQLGTAHAISQVKEQMDSDFLVMNGDLIISSDLIKNLIIKHKKEGPDASMCLVQVKNPSNFGVVSLKENTITDIVEKPESPKSNLANAGIYIFNKRIFEVIEGLEKSSRHEYEITDAIKSMIDSGSVCGFEGDGRWIDVGRPQDLLDANEIVLEGEKLKKDKKANIEPYVTIKGDVHIGKGTLIRSGTYIEGPCFIGENCTIGPNAYLRAHATILDNARIGNAVEIKNSIVMSDTNICHLSYVGDSIIGENCNFGAGTIIANLRVDNDEVRIEIKDKLTKSGRRKFGCIMGDNVKTGINVSILPGRAIYPGAYVEAGCVVRNTIYREEDEV